MASTSPQVGWRRILFHEDLFLVWPGLFFLALGYNGVEQFYQPGDNATRPHMGNPAKLYWLGGGFISLAAIRALLFRIDRRKAVRTASRRAAKSQRRVRRGAGRNCYSHTGYIRPALKPLMKFIAVRP